MTQKIFDTDNEEDMALLWSILPGDVKLIKSYKYYNDEDIAEDDNTYCYNDGYITSILIKINWHDRTEIKRPIPEATEADIGKLCMFGKKEPTHLIHGGFGLLTKIEKDVNGETLYLKDVEMWYNYCRRLTKQEIEELC